MKIYKYLYYSLYFKSSRHNASPEIPVVGYISFTQTNNILSIINLFLFFTKWVKNYNLPATYLVIEIVLFIINYYYFVKLKKGKLIAQDEKYSLGKFFFLTDVYLFSSVIIMAVTYYLYREC
jgi:hypothetical protein